MIIKLKAIVASALRFIAHKIDGKLMVEHYHINNEINLYANGDPQEIAEQLAYHMRMYGPQVR